MPTRECSTDLWKRGRQLLRLLSTLLEGLDINVDGEVTPLVSQRLRLGLSIHISRWLQVILRLYIVNGLHWNHQTLPWVMGLGRYYTDIRKKKKKTDAVSGGVQLDSKSEYVLVPSSDSLSLSSRT